MIPGTPPLRILPAEQDLLSLKIAVRIVILPCKAASCISLPVGLVIAQLSAGDPTGLGSFSAIRMRGRSLLAHADGLVPFHFGREILEDDRVGAVLGNGMSGCLLLLKEEVLPGAADVGAAAVII